MWRRKLWKDSEFKSPLLQDTAHSHYQEILPGTVVMPLCVVELTWFDKVQSKLRSAHWIHTRGRLRRT